MIRVTCEPDPYKRDVFHLSIEGESWRSIHSSLFGKIPRVPKEFRDMDHLVSWYSEKITQKAKEYTYRQLSIRSLLSHQLQKKLSEFLVSDDISSAIIESCIQNGYINDEDWITNFIRSRQRRGDGPRLILAKLAEKGVDRSTAQNALHLEDSGEERQARIREMIEKQRKKHCKNGEPLPQKAIAALLRKGFQYEDISRELNIF